MISRVHAMIDRLEMELGSLDYLCFAFPQVLGVDSEAYGDPSAFVAGAIARTCNPPAGAVKASVSPKHPLPSTYIQLDGISSVEIVVPTNSAKKLLKRKRCLVIEKWGDNFVCPDSEQYKRRHSPENHSDNRYSA